MKYQFTNQNVSDKPIGASKTMIESKPEMKLDVSTGCYVSVERPYETVAQGATKFFEKYGYMVIRGIWDPQNFYEIPPQERGQINYFGSVNKFGYTPNEMQVNGSLARYNHPKYKYAHSQIRIKLEKILDQQLYNTYYYDRFYFVGQRLIRHSDRDACEISLTYQISTNSKKPWGICFENPMGEERYINLQNGDAVLYKGCEREHWREPLKSKYTFFKKIFRNMRKLSDDTYHHQVFFHYVLANGTRSHCANDMSR